MDEKLQRLRKKLKPIEKITRHLNTDAPPPLGTIFNEPATAAFVFPYKEIALRNFINIPKVGVKLSETMTTTIMACHCACTTTLSHKTKGLS